MPIRLHRLKNEIGVYTQSRERFLAIARALNEPCVWLAQPGDNPAVEDYEVVIIDPRSERESRCEKGAGQTRDATGGPHLVVYQCPDETA